MLSEDVVVSVGDGEVETVSEDVFETVIDDVPVADGVAVSVREEVTDSFVRVRVCDAEPDRVHVREDVTSTVELWVSESVAEVDGVGEDVRVNVSELEMLVERVALSVGDRD